MEMRFHMEGASINTIKVRITVAEQAMKTMYIYYKQIIEVSCEGQFGAQLKLQHTEATMEVRDALMIAEITLKTFQGVRGLLLLEQEAEAATRQGNELATTRIRQIGNHTEM